MIPGNGDASVKLKYLSFINRFMKLFKVQSKWTFDEIQPYIRLLSTCLLNLFFLKKSYVSDSSIPLKDSLEIHASVHPLGQFFKTGFT